MGMYDDIKPVNIPIYNDIYTRVITSKEESLADDRLKLQGSCTFIEFMDYIDKLIKMTNQYRQEQIYFDAYSGKINPEDITTPIILYSVYSREPEEPKPRIRQTVADKNDQNNSITILGQRFRYQIEFKIISDTYSSAEKAMEEFEDLMLTYAGFFNAKGVINLRFEKQISDETPDKQEKLYVKTLRYGATLERITLMSDERIKQVIANMNI